MFMRYFAFISYNGLNYSGFQRQPKYKTIQGTIENTLKKIFKTQINIVISSRTDSGVHSLCNCFHFDLPYNINCQRIKECLNKILPLDIVILRIQEVKQDAHSRFYAKKRRYRYIITNKKNPFEVGYFYDKFELLNVEKMDIAAKYLIGTTKFRTFSKVNKNEKHDYECIIYDSFCIKENNNIIFEIEGNRFTHSLVRCLAFNLIQIGSGISTIEEFINRLKSNNEKLKKGIAPANGLILVKIEYDKSIFVD